MPPKPTIFEFTFYSFEPEKRLASFSYAIHFENREPLTFTEQLILPEEQKIDSSIPPALLENILQGLHLIIGISYYKLYCPPEIKLTKPISPEQALFWNKVYRKGLGEFLYRNNLDPSAIALFPGTPEHQANPVDFKRTNRSLVGIGGGKDSLVAVELLKEQKMPATAILTETQRPNAQARTVLKATGLPSLIISRQLDLKIFEKHPDSYNGHIPISAVLAWIGVFTAALYDYRYTIVANEFSSNFGNLEYKGETINHQWSKSQEFETLFQEYIRRFVTPDITYFSLLRPFYELRIAKLFSKYSKYFATFSSCNKVARITEEETKNRWCGACAKCTFVFAILAPWLSKKNLVSIFGKNLFEDESLVPLFRDLVGQGTLKPFDCVGTFEEVQVAFHLSKKLYGKTIVFKTLEQHLSVAPETITRILRTQDAPLVPAPFRFLGMENLLIMGYGKEGKVTKEFIRKKFPKLKVGIADQNRSKNYLQMQDTYDVAVKTPGIPKRFVSIPYTTATNLFFSQIDNLTIGVTGTKGKSTTSSLIYSILKEAGKPVKLLGNIGVPMLGALNNSVKLLSKETIFVLELSSHQLDDSHYSPNIAVVSNLFPEHLPYHEGPDRYYLAKKNIIAFQHHADSFVFNPEDERLVNWLKETQSKAVPFVNDLPIARNELPLLGFHNYNNVRAAVTVARMLGVSDPIIKRAVLNFKPLPHRLEKVGTFKGITFYDDAISTTPESTIMALRSLNNIGTIFLGGEDRGYDFKALEVQVRAAGIKNVVLFPDTGKRLFVDATDLNIFRTDKMKSAIEFAYKHTEQGSICLLSTASPSYSLWKDFNEKGDEFQKYAKLLGKKK